ncbi:MAG: hypothetical protein J5J00_02430 [Deltaproteobacteria bacterium]|nr:hypothetical protein [Deltaproteobacteria bacterium]
MSIKVASTTTLKLGRTVELSFRLLLMHEDRARAAELAKELSNFIPFMGHDIVTNEQAALESHLHNPYDICIVSPAFPDAKMEVLIRDLSQLYAQKYGRMCRFVRYSAEPPSEGALNSASTAGFDCVVSALFDAQDRKRLEELGSEMRRAAEIQEYTRDLDCTMQRILSEVDRVARDRKRGRQTSFNTVSIDFVSDLVEFEPAVFEKYLNSLCNQAEKAEAAKYSKVKIPAAVLKKNLPKLFEDRYAGPSSRVWKKLLKKYGIPAADEATPHSASHETEIIEVKSSSQEDAAAEEKGELPLIAPVENEEI